PAQLSQERVAARVWGVLVEELHSRTPFFQAMRQAPGTASRSHHSQNTARRSCASGVCQSHRPTAVPALGAGAPSGDQIPPPTAIAAYILASSIPPVASIAAGAAIPAVRHWSYCQALCKVRSAASKTHQVQYSAEVSGSPTTSASARARLRRPPASPRSV